MLGLKIPFDPIEEKGEPRFVEVIANDGSQLYTLGLSVMWEVATFIVRG
jgi:hypothetical protein